MNNSLKKSKVFIIEEEEYKTKVAPPPHILPWFFCLEVWDKLPQEFFKDQEKTLENLP